LGLPFGFLHLLRRGRLPSIGKLLKEFEKLLLALVKTAVFVLCFVSVPSNDSIASAWTMLHLHESP
jgi:hypothetical protein